MFIQIGAVGLVANLLAADIAGPLVGFDATHVHPHQAIDAVVEIGVDAKVHKLHPPRFAQLGILLVEGGDGATQVVEPGLERLEIRPVILPLK